VEVPAAARRAMIRGLVAFVNRDAQGLVRDLVTLDFLPPNVDAAAATAALVDVFDGVSVSGADGSEAEGGPGAGRGAGARAEAGAGARAGAKPGAGIGSLPSGSNVRGTNDFLGVVSQLSTAGTK
jgi:aarF domain-containing kinase